MSTFDAEVFTNAALKDTRAVPHLSTAALTEINELGKDIEATLAALEIERDGRRARALRDDLQIFLPARISAILSYQSGATTYDRLRVELTYVQRATQLVALAFTQRAGL